MRLLPFYISSALAVLAAAGLMSLFFEPAGLPLGLLVGGILAIANIRGMHKSLARLLSPERPARSLMLAGSFRLVILFLAITLLAATRAVDMVGLLMGFALVPMVLLLEALRQIRASGGDSGELDKDTQEQGPDKDPRSGL